MMELLKDIRLWWAMTMGERLFRKVFYFFSVFVFLALLIGAFVMTNVIAQELVLFLFAAAAGFYAFFGGKSGSWWLLATLGAVCAVGMLSGCTVKQPPKPQPVAIAPTPKAPESVVWQPVIEQHPALVVKPVVQKVREYKDLYTKTTATLVFKPDHRHTLVCPAWEPLTIRLLPGETYQDTIAGDGTFWMIQPLMSSVGGEPVSVVAIRRGPEAPPTVIHIVTDKNIYQLRLLPSGKGENRDLRLINFYDPASIERREEEERFAAERRLQKAQEPRYPSLNFATVRQYQVNGDAVSWRPVRVTGDHARTLIELPANTGAAQPTLSVMRGGAEQRINYRTIPGNGERGAVMIADEALTEARLVGNDGAVTITPLQRVHAGGN